MKKNLGMLALIMAFWSSLLVVTMMTIRLMTAGRLFLRLIRQKH